MTQSEKDELVQAFKDLEADYDHDDDPGTPDVINLVNDLANYHDFNFDDIHFNLPTQPEKDVFFPWHRRQMFELEQAMQNINSKISIPYWDWTLDNTYDITPGKLWDPAFMGGFDALWNLDRIYNNGTLPTAGVISTTQATSSDIYLYSNAVERGDVHVGGHAWTGGVMASGNSPRDPIFYLHHGMVDKLWQDWVELHGYSSGDDLYIKNLLPRYDGVSQTSAGVTLPAVNPDNMIDSKTWGVFYAENQLAELYNYTVNNTYRTQEEVFYYQYTIEAKDDFIIPSSKKAKFESVNNIILKPGFHAQEGSGFIAKLDTDYDITTFSKTSRKKTDKKSFYTNFRIVENVYTTGGLIQEVKTFIDPRRKDNLGLEFKDVCEPCEIEILNSQNDIEMNKTLNNATNTDINLAGLMPGNYVLQISRNSNVIFNKELIKL
ncbi:tyrosinase family protein [Thalassobellus sediminis]|uniref:tyrosinase family protein n=1 Tax=Thalassobellus sediminis TaxID=3367753 RepID=UPI0037AFBEF0